MLELEFNIVDVFAESKFGGNQLAVFKNTHSLKTNEMQQIAKEMNYSETTFVRSDEKRDNGYDVRIFTPQTELPFAGHPTFISMVLSDYGPQHPEARSTSPRA